MMKKILTLTVLAASLVITTSFAATPELPDATAYDQVRKAVDRSVEAIDKDIKKLKDTLPQLADLESRKISTSRNHWITTSYHYRRAETWVGHSMVAGSSFTFDKDGCYLLIEFRLYDPKLDPRTGGGVMPANPGPHFLVKKNNVPFGLSVKVDAEDNASGQKFKERINQLIDGHLAKLKEELGAEAISWDRLTHKPTPPLTPKALNEKAYDCRK